jgi:RNA polymerase sigma factor (TIGR02999 family)
MTPSPHDVTRLLKEWGGGNQSALEQLMPLVHGELCQLAHQYMQRENPAHTLQTTALVNEAYLKLIDQRQVSWQNRSHFFGIAAQLMRRILVDHARKQHNLKRGGHALQVSLSEAESVSREQAANVVALDAALKALAKINSRQSKIVELRFFGGLSIEEAAEVICVSPGTVMRDWTFARAWLRKEMSDSG